MEALKSKAENILHGHLHKSGSGKGKTVLISGGSGFVATHILNVFLSRGYHVRTTGRSQQSAEKVKAAHPNDIDQLSFSIVEDIQKPGAFDEAVKGVDGVVHTASPFATQVEDNERDLLNPAIKGTTEILHSIKNYNPSVKRVIIISSVASILDLAKDPRPGYIYSEKDWNPCTYEEAKTGDGGTAYCASKLFAEKAAWEFVEKEKPNFSITTILPPMVYGPAAHIITNLNHMNESSSAIYALMNGSSTTVPKTVFYGFVDVRDVAEAHVCAYENPAAGGQRYLCAAGTYTFHRICEVVRKEFPELRSRTPARPDPETQRGMREEEHHSFDNGKIKRELGMSFRTMEEMVKDQVNEFLRLEKELGGKA